jgi:hypothetical protein
MNSMEKLGVVPISRMGEEEDAEERALLHEMFLEAQQYIQRFRWCRAIRSANFGMGAGKIVAIFLFEINNAASPQDDLLWVITGDVPPACLTAVDGPGSPAEALETSIELMGEWVQAVRQGKPVDDLIPVNVAPTLAWAGELESRLAMLHEFFLQDE